MTPAVVNTNVLVVANKQTPQASPACIQTCVDCLDALKRSGLVVVDEDWLVFDEYARNALSSGQPDVGDAFLKWLLINRSNAGRVLSVALLRREPDGEFAEFPDDPDLAQFDRDDRKFVALVRASPIEAAVYNATDRDWWIFRAALERHGVRIEFLCPELMSRSRR